MDLFRLVGWKESVDKVGSGFLVILGMLSVCKGLGMEE